MKLNENIKRAKRNMKILLVIFILYVIFFLFLINFIASQSDFKDNNLSKLIIIWAVLFIILVVPLFIIRISKLNSLCHVDAQKCIIEDFIIIGYHRDGRIHYRIYPVVKKVGSDELYFTYGKYSLSYYNSIYVRNANTLMGINIVRKNKSVVQIGDYANFYIGKLVDVNIHINSKKNTVKLNHKKFKYNHINNKYDINIFNKLKFFEGVVEVEDVD